MEPAVTDGTDGSSVEPESAVTGREQTRQRVIEAATGLLEREGRDAVTTRAVAVAAGMQPPVIYRLFGDKEGLLEAVAEHGFEASSPPSTSLTPRRIPSRTCGRVGISRLPSAWRIRRSTR
jgi:AcrR family transcriptional regulator